MTKILMFSGSARKESFNKKLVLAAARIATQKGAAVTSIDLNDYPMPIYNGDYEEKEGHPEQAKALQKLIQSSDMILIASPEYNGLFSPLLKNVIDWVSRVDVQTYNAKIAAIVSASPGSLGGLRGLSHLRTLLNNLNVLVIPEQIAIGQAFEAFDDDNTLKDPKQYAMLESVIDALLTTTKNKKE